MMLINTRFTVGDSGQAAFPGLPKSSNNTLTSQFTDNKERDYFPEDVWDFFFFFWAVKVPALQNN